MWSSVVLHQCYPSRRRGAKLLLPALHAVDLSTGTFAALWSPQLCKKEACSFHVFRHTPRNYHVSSGELFGSLLMKYTRDDPINFLNLQLQSYFMDTCLNLISSLFLAWNVLIWHLKLSEKDIATETTKVHNEDCTQMRQNGCKRMERVSITMKSEIARGLDSDMYGNRCRISFVFAFLPYFLMCECELDHQVTLAFYLSDVWPKSNNQVWVPWKPKATWASLLGYCNQSL